LPVQRLVAVVRSSANLHAARWPIRLLPVQNGAAPQTARLAIQATVHAQPECVRIRVFTDPV
jgi:hypothetical protein